MADKQLDKKIDLESLTKNFRVEEYAHLKLI